MFSKCDNCKSSPVHVRKFPDFKNKKLCRACSDTVLGHSTQSPKDFKLQHLSEALGQLYNQLNDRISIIEKKLGIEADTKLLLSDNKNDK